MTQREKLRDILEHGIWLTKEAIEDRVGDLDCPASDFLTIEQAEYMIMNLFKPTEP